MTCIFSADPFSKLFEGLFNRRIRFTHHEWEQLVQNDPDKSKETGFMMRCLARISSIVEHGREAFKNGDMDEIANVRNETRDLYDGLRKTADKLHTQYRVPVQQKSFFSEISDHVFSIRLHAHWQRTYGLVLAIAMFFNRILCSLTLVVDHSNTLRLEATYFAKEIIAVAKDAVIFDP